MMQTLIHFLIHLRMKRLGNWSRNCIIAAGTGTETLDIVTSGVSVDFDRGALKVGDTFTVVTRKEEFSGSSKEATFQIGSNSNQT